MTVLDRGDLSAAKRELLQRRLRGSGAAAGAAPISRRSEAGPPPLSVTQEQLWYFSQLAPDNPVYNEAVTIRKEGSFSPDTFRRAFDELLRRHEIWRTTFRVIDGEPVQVVGPPPHVPLPVLDLSGLSYAAAEARAAQLAAAEFGRPYDLARGPLVRPLLVRLSADHHRLYLGLHHIIFDGVTLYRVILPELITLYDDIAAGRAVSLAEPATQYGDYAAWERGWIETPAVTARTEWWRGHLADAPALELPLDRPRPARQRFRGAMEPFTLERELVDGLRELGRRHGATLFQTLAAGFAALLHRYSHQDDVIFGTIGDLRQRPELQNMVGYCLTPLVVRADLRRDPTFEDVLARVGAEVIDGLDHLVPFERLIRELRPTRDGRANPIFQVTLVLEPKVETADSEWSLHQLEVEIGNAVGTAKFDLAVECDERPEGFISGRLSYDTDLFRPDTARRLARHWQRLLREIVADPAAPVSRLPLLDEEERRQQLSEWNGTDRRLFAGATVHELVTAQARRTPDSVALVYGEEQLTYRQLEQRADAVAGRLRAAGAGQGTVVAICVERSLDMVVGLLGILKCGAAYLPLDPRHPADRRRFMVQDAGAAVLLTQRHLVPSLRTLAPAVMVVDRLPGDAGDPVGIDVPAVHAIPRNCAYVMYTSGSTGRPKGVLVRHDNVVNRIHAAVEQPGMNRDDVVLAVTTYSFDISVQDIFPALTTGARIVIASTDEAMDVRRLSRLIEASGATYLNLTPATWLALIEIGWTGSPRLVAVSGGEALSEALVNALLPRVAELWNCYGPTETTVTATCARVLAGEPITLGRPIADTRVYLLDGQLSLVPVGVTGEICIAGAGVADGYVNRPEETAKRFRPDPFRPDQRMYRSGDLGRYLPDGRIQYLGRADSQLKIRGFRIEPGEIEAALQACEGVASAVVVIREGSDASDRRLVAYVVPRGSRAPTVEALRAALRRTLPEYMIPAAFVFLPALPVSPTGKVDRAALPAPAAPAVEATATAAPTSPLERDLAGIWARVLGVQSVGPDANFFDLGGHSLLAVRTLLEVERELGYEVPLAALFEGGGSVRGMAAAIRRAADPDNRPDGAAPRLFFVHPQPATVPSMRHFTGPLGPDQTLEVLLPERPNGRFDLTSSVVEMTRPLVHSVRAAQPCGPYFLAGYSIGGMMAYELATQLIAAGESVAWLGLLDTPAPGMLRQRLSQRQLFFLYASRGRRVLIRQCRSALRRELQKLRVRVRPDPQVFDHRGAEILGSRYSPDGVAAHLAVFGTEVLVTDQGFGPSLGWESVHKGPIEVHHVPGDHDSLLQQQHVDEVARVFSRSLLQARDRQDVASLFAPTEP